MAELQFLTLDDAAAMPQFAHIASGDVARLERCVDAANWYITRRVRVPVDVTSPPGDLVQAAVLMTNRLLARDQSAEGLVGAGDQIAYLPSSDRDVDQLIAPWAPAVFA